MFFNKYLPILTIKAMLRMDKNTSKEERLKRINEVINDVLNAL